MNTRVRPASVLLPEIGVRGGVSALLVLAALTVNFLWASGHDEQRCVELVLLAALAMPMAARAGTAGHIAWLSPAARCCLGGFLVLGAASSLAAFSLRHAVYEWSVFVLLLLVAALLAADIARRGADGLQTLLRYAGLACILYSVRLLLFYAMALANGVQLDMHALAVGFSNVRFLNHAQTALLPLIVLLVLQAPKGSAMRRVWFALAAFWWALLFVGEARASILGLGAACVVACAVRRSHARGFVQAMALAALAGAVLYVLGFILLPMLAGLDPIGVPSKVMARTAADPSSGRNLLWKLALQLIAAHPWLGVGPHHFAHEGAKLYIGAHPHDWLLQIAVEWGVPALLFLLGAVGLGARALARGSKRIADGDLRQQQILVALLASCAAVFVDGLFSGVLVMPQSQLAIVFVIACASGWLRSLDTETPAPAASPAACGLTALLAAAALCAMAWSVAPDFMRHARGEPATPAEQRINHLGNWPRMWEAGYF